MVLITTNDGYSPLVAPLENFERSGIRYTTLTSIFIYSTKNVFYEYVSYLHSYNGTHIY